MAVGALTRVGRENPLHSLRWSRCSEGASQRNFDADQIRRFAKMLSGQVGRGSSVVLRPAASQDRCQGGMQGLAWRSFAQVGEGSTKLLLPRAIDPH
jgi:hypothetical protein